MKLLMGVMHYLINVIESELISATPEIIKFIEKELLLLVKKINDILDSKISHNEGM